MITNSKVTGFLDKRGEGALGKGWKRRYFELDEGKLYYYLISEDVRQYKGCIAIQDITHIAPFPGTEEGCRFYIDTRIRRYELRTLEGELKMWFWIEAIRNAQVRETTKKLSLEREERRLKKVQSKENEFIVSELQLQLSQFKERFKLAESEWKSYSNNLKRQLHHCKKENSTKSAEIEQLKGKFEQSQRELEVLRSAEGVKEVGSSSPLQQQRGSHSSTLFYSFMMREQMSEEKESAKDKEIQNLEELLTEAEADIKHLKEKVKKTTEELNAAKEDLEASKEESARYIQKLKRELDGMQEKEEFQRSSKQTLEHYNQEMEKQIKYLSDRVQSLEKEAASKKEAPPIVRKKTVTMWVPDHSVSHCKTCGTPFSLLKRKHHCRLCGFIFCAVCANNYAPLSEYGGLFVRLCNPCAKSLPVQ